MRNDALRKVSLCASEWPAIVGVDPYHRTPLSIYLDKLGLVEPQPDTPELRWGRLIEQVALVAYMEDTKRLIHEQDTAQHSEYPWIAATPDALAHDRGVEVKVVGPAHAKEWAWGVPQYVLVQVTINMAVFDRPCWDVARLLLVNRDWKILTVERDRELEALLIEEGRRFREDYWLKGVIPQMDASPQAARYLAQRYPVHDEVMLEAIPEIETLAGELKRLKRVIASATAKYTTIKHQLLELIGSHAGITGDGFQITWKSRTDGIRVFRPSFDEEGDD